MENHKHCIYCGDVVSPNTSTFCTATSNPVPCDTVGRKPHVWLSPEFPPQRVIFAKGEVAEEKHET